MWTSKPAAKHYYQPIREARSVRGEREVDEDTRLCTLQMLQLYK